MSKKNMALAAAIMICSSAFVLPVPKLSEHREQKRLESLYSLYDNGLLNATELAEAGFTMSQIIDRDIAILEKDSECALKHKQIAENFVVSKVPTVLKGISIGSGLLSVLGFVETCATTYTAKKTWDSGDNNSASYAEYFLSYFPSTLNYPVNPTVEVRQTYRKVTENDFLVPPYDESPNEFKLQDGLDSPYFALFSLIFAIFSKYIFSKGVAFKQWNAEYIQSKQDQVERNEAIVEQLRQLKDENSL
jgi:hypothetical protein